MDEYCRITHNQYDTEHPTDQATDQPGQSVNRVIVVLKGDMKNTEKMEALDLRHRVSFREN